MGPPSFSQLLAAARRGDAHALGRLLADESRQLQLWAERQLGDQLRSRMEPNDLVQQTLLEAQRDFGLFRGSTRSAWVSWLGAVLNHNLHSAQERHRHAQKRSLDQERSLEVVVDRQGPSEILIADQTSPSQRAIKGEVSSQLALALADLPQDQQAAVRLRHLEGYSLKEMAIALERSETAVAGLLKRGLQKLREQLAADNSSDD